MIDGGGGRFSKFNGGGGGKLNGPIDEGGDKFNEFKFGGGGKFNIFNDGGGGKPILLRGGGGGRSDKIFWLLLIFWDGDDNGWLLLKLKLSIYFFEKIDSFKS